MSAASCEAVWLWIERVVAWAVLAAARTTLQRRPRRDAPGAEPRALADPAVLRRVQDADHALANHILLVLEQPGVGVCDGCSKRLLRNHRGRALDPLCYDCRRAAGVRP